jgi:hypothetical protein
MVKRNLPTVMRPVSAAQLVANARGLSGRTAGSAALQTNRGNKIDYQIVSGIHPQRQQIVSDTGDHVHGDGLSWILSFEKPQLLSGVYDPGLAVEVSFGVGGARESLVVNASPGWEMVIPADAINVYIVSLSDPPVALDSVTRCTALLHRAVPSGAESVHVSFTIPAALGAFNVPVPSFANDFAIYGNEVGAPAAGAAIFDATALLQIQLGASGVPPITYIGTTLLAMFRTGQRIQVPGNATAINMTYPAVLRDSFLLDFSL